MRRLALLALLASTTLLSASARAETVMAEGGRRVAIVIGNNAGTVIDATGSTVLQPDLAFADDDAVRMAQLLESLGHEVVVLTRPDAATARHLDGLVPLPPTTTSLRAATAQLARGPRPTSLVLYYAGHGDAERGTGRLLLEDGVLRHGDLRQLVDDVGAVTSHVVLDACNAFFAVHARGPGGRAWRTVETAGEALRSERSDVGVFVSTSAEAQVWEWDQLQGGVFSHAVRSGLRGAADANADARVTYAELLAFVDVAASGLVDSVYAPRVHARAPRGDDVLVDLGPTPRVPLEAETPGARLTLRDDSGGIVVDVRAEAGFVPVVVVPRGPLWLEEDGRGRPFIVDESSSTPSSSWAGAGATARGPPGVVARLWTTGFGPAAMTATRAKTAQPATEVFGLSTAQEQRLLLHLRTLRDDAVRARHLAQGAGAMWSGTAALGLGAAALGSLGLEQYQSALMLSGIAGLTAAFAVVQGTGVLIPIGDDERLATAILATPATSARERAARVTQAVETIEASADGGPGRRLALGAVGIGSGVLLSAMGGFALGCPSCVELSSDRRIHDAMGGGFIFLGAVGASLGVMAAVEPTTGERLQALLRDDPDAVAP